MSRTLAIAIALITVSVSIRGTFAEDRDAEPAVQEWSISLVKDTAVIRATDQTQMKFVKGTIRALQKNGVENFALRADTDVTPEGAQSLAIRLHDGEVSLSASNDLPYRHLTSILSMFNSNGLTNIKICLQSRTDHVTGRKLQEAR